MTHNQEIAKSNAGMRIGRAALIIAAILLIIYGILMLPSDNPGHYASHPNPALDYADAVKRVESLRSSEVGFNLDCHTILMTHGDKAAKAIVFVPGYGSCPAAFKELGTQFYERGYNVLVAPLPYNGLADRLNTQQAKLRSEDLVRYTDQVVDIGRGLGERLTLVGTSAGGLVTGWAVQQRQDVDQAVLISPGFGFAAVPARLSKLTSRALTLLPNFYIWEESVLDGNPPPDHSYPRDSTHALAQILRLSLATQALARQKTPVISSILVITNLNDPGIDNGVTNEVVRIWSAHGNADVQTYQFPIELHLGHDLTDLQQSDQNAVNVISTVVYPKLLEMIDK